MTRNEFMTGLRAAHGFLQDFELVLSPRWYSSFEPSEEFQRLANIPDVSYSDLFRAGLRKKDYNILLLDYSFFQFYYSDAPADLSLRYAYYPNPFRAPLPAEFIRDFDLDPWDAATTELYLQWLDEQDDLSAITPIRYEVSLCQYREYEHPASHIHFGIGVGGRWPVAKILTPDTFAILISKLYHGRIWQELCANATREGNEPAPLEQRLADACSTCAVLDEQYFSTRERHQLHLT